MRKTIFLDRDGLINQKAASHRYIERVKDFIFRPGVFDALRQLNKAGFQVIVITNQRGIARGHMTREQLDLIHRHMCKQIETHGGKICGIYVCPHEIGICECRKPKIGLFLQAERDFEIDKGSSWMIGDSDADVEAGARYGVRAIKTDDFLSATKYILSLGCDKGCGESGREG